MNRLIIKKIDKTGSVPNRRAQSKSFMMATLSELLQIPENEIEFTIGEKGKPYLKDRNDFFFNISDSGDYWVFAYAEKEIGVDVEFIRPRNIDGIINRYFPKEEQDYVNSFSEEKRLKAFISLWTCKEAYLKWRGAGLSGGLDKWPIIIENSGISVKNHEYDAVYFKQFDFDANYKLTVCSSEKDFSEEIRFDFL